MADSDKKGFSLYVRLSMMMFLQFAVWGAWSVMIANHMESNLHFDGKHISYVFGTTAFGAIISPLIAGWIADRYMPNQIYTGLSHLVGAGLLYWAWFISAPVAAGVTAPFWPLEITMIVYAIFYFPTIGLTNAIAFHHMGDSNKFGLIRVWGSLGWIAVQTGLGFYLIHWNNLGVAQGLSQGMVQDAAKQLGQALGNLHSRDCLMIATVASVLMGFYSFTLPNTPPAKNAKNPYAFLEAFKLTENRNFAVLLIISFIVAIELPFYYNLTSLFLANPTIQNGIGLGAGKAQFYMTFGQWGEVAMMALLYPMIRWGGIRWTIFLGILAWPVRYAIFSLGHPTWLVIASLPLHGICYAFFFAGGMIAVERLAHKDIKASAQGLIVFATNGLGMLVGHFLSGQIHDRMAYNVVDPATGQTLIAHHWAGVFAVPIVVTVIAGIAFLILWDEKQYQKDTAIIAAEPVEATA
ncbi:MAG TPA: MFS transporter [Armatimonadota bacterium]